MKVIIVDDEPKAIELLESYLKHFSAFDLVSTFRNGFKALEFLNTNEVDLIFMDINMPHLNGLSLAKMIPLNTKVIFTTAHSEHAVESYEINAIDYLLKPISLERFSKTVTKLLDNDEFSHRSKPVKKSNSLFIKSGLDTYQIVPDEIKYLQKDGNYMLYFVNDKKIMARQSIQEALSILPNQFLQIQKSYIVNFSKVDYISNESVKIGGIEIPIGSNFKLAVSNRIRNQNLL